jgi:hypothetical protein
MTATREKGGGVNPQYYAVAPVIAPSAHNLTAAPLFKGAAPRVGTAGFGAEKDFRIEIRLLFRTTLNTLRKRGSSRNSLNAPER